MATVNADVIASVSLLLALVAALFGIWYAEINDALEVEVPEGRTARNVARRKVSPVLGNKALPLAAAAMAISGVFLPRAVAITWTSVSLLGSDWKYDDLLAAFLLTEAILLILAIVTVSRALRLMGIWIALIR